MRPVAHAQAEFCSMCAEGLMRECFQSGPEPDAALCNAVATACEARQEWEQAVEVLRQMSAAEVEADIITFSAIISACEADEQWAFALAVLEVIANNAAIAACAAVGEWAQAAVILYTMRSPDVVSFNSAIAACEAGANWQMAACLLQDEMNETQGTKPDLITYSAAISVCQKILAKGQAVALLDEVCMLVDGNWPWAAVRPNAVEKLSPSRTPTHRTMLHTCSARLQHVQGTAFSLLEEVPSFEDSYLEALFLCQMCAVFLDLRHICVDSNRLALAVRSLCVLIVFCRRTLLHQLLKLAGEKEASLQASRSWAFQLLHSAGTGIVQDLGRCNLPAITAAYKSCVSSGDTDADGQKALFLDHGAAFKHIMTCHGPMVPSSEGEGFGEMNPVSALGVTAFEDRLAQADVQCVVFEAVWGKWSHDLAIAHGKKAFGLMPSYREPFRAAYCHDAIWDFDNQCIVRNRAEDIDSFQKFAPEAVSYIIADCLVGKAMDSGGRRRFGAFLPSCEDVDVCDVELQNWLDGAGESDPRTVTGAVTLVALGSQTTLEGVCENAEERLLQGCLLASPRVLAVLKETPTPRQLSPKLLEAVSCGRLRYAKYLPQWAVLNHPLVRCFVSHGGANSAHEALACGVPVVPLPFFDDQFYIASRLEELYGYSCKLRKATLRSDSAIEQVAASVRQGLEVTEATLQQWRDEVLKEDGAATAARSIAVQQETVLVIVYRWTELCTEPREHLERFLGAIVPRLLEVLTDLACGKGRKAVCRCGLWKLALEALFYLVEDSLAGVARCELEPDAAKRYWDALITCFSKVLGEALPAPRPEGSADAGALLSQVLGNLLMQRILPCSKTPASVAEDAVHLLQVLVSQQGMGSSSLRHFFALCAVQSEVPEAGSANVDGDEVRLSVIAATARGASTLSAKGIPCRSALLGIAVPALVAHVRSLFALYLQDEEARQRGAPVADAAAQKAVEVRQALTLLQKLQVDEAAVAAATSGISPKARSACSLAGSRGLVMALLPQLASLASVGAPDVRRAVREVLEALATELEL
eukprot:s2220_g9.t1